MLFFFQDKSLISTRNFFNYIELVSKKAVYNALIP